MDPIALGNVEVIRQFFYAKDLDLDYQNSLYFLLLSVKTNLLILNQISL